MAAPPQTDEGWFVLHEFHSIDWELWRNTPSHEQQRVVAEAIGFLDDGQDAPDASAGDSAVFSILGADADLLFVHLRPTLDALSALEREFQCTEFAAYTERTRADVSVTEVSGYVSTAYFDDEAATDPGVEQYVESKLRPSLPEDGYVCYYPMSKRRDEQANWYELPFEDRAELMAEHGETGKQYAGEITQLITAATGYESHEWGVTLFADDPVSIKRIVYEMRFDEVSARYGEFGEFSIGRRFPPGDLGAYLDGERVPTDTDDVSTPTAESSDSQPPAGSDADIREELAELDVYVGQPTGEDVYATVVYSTADPDEVFEATTTLREQFDHYPTHVRTSVYEPRKTGDVAVVSVWETGDAAETAAGFLSELPDVIARAESEIEAGFGTMGMFYTVAPEHRDAFVGRFDAVTELLETADGHRRSTLMINHEDENDTFIASRWRSREDAMDFFGSREFRETVEFGRDILVDQPRHVFLT